METFTESSRLILGLIILTVVSAIVYFSEMRKQEKKERAEHESKLKETEVVAVKCGHNTRLMARVTAFGKTVKYVLPINADGGVDYCHECLTPFIRQCAKCQKLIFRKELVSLQTYVQSMGKVKSINLPGKLLPKVLVCMDPKCTDPQADSDTGQLRMNTVLLFGGTVVKLG